MINVDKINAWITTEASALFGGVALIALILGMAYVVWFGMPGGAAKQKPLFESCYGVYGASGRYYPSTQPPQFADGLWYVITHDEWNAVGDFEAAHYDRECLRRRYPENTEQWVPAVDGVDK